MEKSENSTLQVRLIPSENEDEKFQQIVQLNFESGDFIHLLDVLNSKDDNVFINTPILNVL